jgi:Ser/Thr protein kinase RdoA (MazF antagonist)
MNEADTPAPGGHPEYLHAFCDLSPDAVLNAVEAVGYRCDGRVSALNSYENRVYQVGIEDTAPLIAKFYRPGRWSDACVLEEHAFTLALRAEEVPVIAPVADDDGATLHHAGVHRLALYPRIGGRAPELDRPEHLRMLGHCLARIHNIGALEPFAHRPVLDLHSFASEPGAYLLENGFIPPDLQAAYRAILSMLLERLRGILDDCADVRLLRLHGDCHAGNILIRDDAPFIVDFDDARTGPAVQDLWMLLSGDRRERNTALYDLLDGYTEFRRFDARELRLVEVLRTLRMIHYAGWLARRWDDPAFPRAFPWFNSQRYWEEHILSLKEQYSALEEPSLEWQED